ncbi:MAG: kefC [Chlamydiales bacterium]|jgi:CPA2 family monovalent cation:H+ antiporter-2|nr:kefC [Chlamydiales bacterium]
MDHNLEIVVILTLGFTLASLLGYLAERFKLPSIIGYLLAGYIIGPYSPGFTADREISEQLAEVGVILMLFGVGMHFKLEDLLRVKKIALPGAFFQTLASTFIAMFFVFCLGWKIENGLILGLAISVASTVVLVRSLSDNHLLNTPQGHIAVGWLIVEDIITVGVLILLPMFAIFCQGGAISLQDLLGSIGYMIAKLTFLTAFMFTWGQKMVSYALTSIARLRSQEFFTLSVVALILLIAAGSTFLFGTSIALGAFIAGMVIGKTDLKHQATNNALPLKDIFCVIFFLSVGMLFNPMVIAKHFLPFLATIFVILVVKPLAAFAIVISLKSNLKTALTVAISLAQIGEFSFILAEEATKLNVLPQHSYDLLVACAMLSITLNPILFKFLDKIESAINKKNYKFLGKITPLLESPVLEKQPPQAITVGFGPIGQAITQILEAKGIIPLIIEQNIDMIPKLKGQKRQVIYGDATQVTILEAAKIDQARYLVITIPNIDTTRLIIETAQATNPKLLIFGHTKYITEKMELEKAKVKVVCSEEESLKTFVKLIEKSVA